MREGHETTQKKEEGSEYTTGKRVGEKDTKRPQKKEERAGGRGGSWRTTENKSGGSGGSLRTTEEEEEEEGNRAPIGKNNSI